MSESNVIRWATLQYVTNEDYKHLKDLINSDDENSSFLDIRDMKFTAKNIGRITYDKHLTQWALKLESRLSISLTLKELITYRQTLEAAEMSITWLEYHTDKFLENA